MIKGYCINMPYLKKLITMVCLSMVHGFSPYLLGDNRYPLISYIMNPIKEQSQHIKTFVCVFINDPLEFSTFILHSKFPSFIWPFV